MATPSAGPVVTAPDPKDVTHVQFRALRRIALNGEQDDQGANDAAKRRLQSVDVASKFGKVAAGKVIHPLPTTTNRQFSISACRDGFYVFDVSELEALDQAAGKDLKTTDIKPNELSKAQKIALPGTPTHMVVK